MNGRAPLVARVLAVVAAMVCLPWGAAWSAPPAAPGDSPVMVVLDVSGSMNDATSSDQVKIDAARAAVLDLIGALSSRDVYGLVSYPGGRDVDGCYAGTQVTPLGPLRHRSALAQARGLHPDGETPTGPALQYAASIMRASGYTFGTIVLVSDGESNCGEDPCVVAQTLRSEGFEVTVNTVGFDISDSGSDELQCIASATGGRHVDVDDADGLDDAIAAARGGLLQLDVDMPSSLPVVTGSGSAGTPVSATVTNRGTRTATDVRLSLSIGTNGRAQVVKPVRFLGNLASGASRTVSFVVRPDQNYDPDPLAWVSTATSSNSPPEVVRGTVRTDASLSSDNLGALFSQVERVAVIGDSYSSGEGSGQYTDNSSGDASNWCHRSSWAYGPELFGERDTTMIACSGAVARDLTAQQKSHDQLMVPQLLKLRAEAVSVDSPDAALLTLGGNDIGFGEIVKSCLFTANCQKATHYGGRSGEEASIAVSASDYYLELARAVSADLVKAYQGVDAVVNDRRALARRGGRIAPIVVLPYVRIVPETSPEGSAPKGCFLGFNPSEIAWMNEVIDQLNESVEWAVGQLRADGRPVYYVDEVVGAFQPQHTMCERTGSFARLVSVNGIVRFADLPLLDEEQRQELAHPNQDGYEAVARAVAAWSRTTTPVTAGPAPGYVSRIQSGPGFWDKVNHGLWGTAEPGQKIDVEVDGFAPETRVTFTIRSRARALGAVTTDADGRAHLETTLPTDLEPGHHVLHSAGMDPDGALLLQHQQISVHRPGFSTALTVLALGCLLIISAAARLILVRARRAAHTVASASYGSMGAGRSA